MSSLAHAVSAASRPLAVRMRPDLTVVAQRIGARRVWAVKDPLAMSYFRLRDEELAVLEMLDGQASATEIIARFERRFAPRRLTPERLQTFLTRLHRDGLILSNATGQGAELLERTNTARRRKILSSLTNLLAIRFPGFNPTPVLQQLDGCARVLFSRTVVVLSLALICAAGLLVATHWRQFSLKLPEASYYFTPRNAVLAVFAISLLKVLHELGHALVCRRFGGECHELGPMLLVFAPCLYCDVSDSWMFDGKWRRIAVAAAGIYVEAVLAAAATFGWWWSEPGVFNALCMNIMVVGSLNTLLFNGNPLLRYDGYYVLSDLVNIPNLAEQSSAVIREIMSRLLLGARARRETTATGRERAFLALYGVAAFAYRAVLVVVLLWCCYRALVPYRLEALVVALSLSVAGGILAAPLLRGWRFARTPTLGDKVPRVRALVLTLIGLGLLAVASLAPLPLRVTAPVVIEPCGAQRIYVAEPGTLEFAVRPGDQVVAGQTIAQLRNPELDLEIARLTGQRDQQKVRVESLERRRGRDRTAAAEIPAAREALVDLEERLVKRQADRTRLTLTTPVGGTVLPPEWNGRPIAPGSLPVWKGTPLRASNVGALLETGTLVCLVGDPRHVEAVAIIDQSEVGRLVLGQRAEVKIDQAAGAVIEGKITEIAEVDADVAPKSLAKTGEVASRTDVVGQARPLSASYQVRVTLAATERTLLLGAPGRVRIHAEPESLLARLWRRVRGSFNFPV